MPELTAEQMAAFERLRQLGFTPVAFPLYAAALGVRRGPFVALLEPVRGGLRLLSGPCYLMDGNPGVRVSEDGREWFRWKKKRVAATPELLAAAEEFAAELARALGPKVAAEGRGE